MEKNALCLEVEKTACRMMQTPRDFDSLVEKIFSRTHERVSASTLKRLWGYLDSDVQPRRFTLDVLSRYVGYADYDSFLSRSGESESNLILSRRLRAADLFVGQQVRLTWLPDRVCVVRHEGEGRFVVEEAQHTKLSAGDTFVCHLVIDHEPLYLDALIHEGGAPTAYVAGRDHGVCFELI